MFEFILRRTVFKALSKEDQDTAMLLKYKIKTDFISQLLISVFGALPLASLITLLINFKDTLSDVIQCVVLILVYIIFAVWFVLKFHKPIESFKYLLSANMYSSRFVLKGNAISKSDFDIIKKENEKLHYLIMTQQVNGYCYAVCFETLKCLKKGTLLFIATKPIKTGNVDEEDRCAKEYTMHVLYVNDNWCFDTYSQRQYPLEEVMKRFKAKTYRSFTYEDVDGKTYDEFKKEQAPALAQWCDANDCYQKWLKDD